MSDAPFSPRLSGLRLHSTMASQSRLSSAFHEDPKGLGLFGRLSGIPAQDAGSASVLNETSLLADDNEDPDRGKTRTDVLFPQFLEVLQAHSHDGETFDVIQELTQACRAVVDQLELDIERGVGGAQGTKQRELTINWLKQEINTWRLLHALYHDRVLLQGDNAAEDEMQDGPTLGGSEKEVITQLYALNATLREYQLVVDWLEACFEQQEKADALHCHDRMMAWENTLFQLENQQGAAFGRSHEIVRQLDPDAPVREKRPLHALDEEDNLRLSRAIFLAIRSGHIDEALKLCKHYGQTWRAAILEGWRLHEDPNYDQHAQAHALAQEKLPIEGNPRRDVWKKCAWLLASESKKHDEYTRATAGVFCGHLGSLKSLLHSSWHDLLWGYLKVQIDIRVESEIRGCCLKRYHPMPEDYWNGKMTLEQIFDELLVAKDVAVRDFAQGQLGVIQQHLILDTTKELLQHMCRWLETPLPPHQLRFMAHIVLFLRQIGRVDQEHHAERILAAYVEVLIQRRQPQLIAYYTAALPSKMQVQLYAKFLELVEERKEREAAVDAALHAGLDVAEITRYTVEHIRQAVSPGASARSGDISPTDRKKIYALEWLTHLTEQRGELLWQANAMIRHYLAHGKLECVRQTFVMVPGDMVSHLMATYGSVDNLPAREECSLKEYLCYKIYLAAIDAFNEWTRLQQSRPQAPTAAKGSSSSNRFTDRVASEHKEQTYRNDLQRWEMKLAEQSKVTIDALYNVLLFPEKGWLNDPFIAQEPEDAALLNWEHRLLQLEKLRSICLPEVALLLHEVMFKSEDYAGCVRLADEISNERRQLYKVYTKHKLAELLAKIADASLELLNKKLDPWGYPLTA